MNHMQTDVDRILKARLIARANFEGTVERDPIGLHLRIDLVCGKCRWIVCEDVLPLPETEIELHHYLLDHEAACSALPIMFRRRMTPLLAMEREKRSCGHCSGSKRCFCILCREVGAKHYFSRRCSVCKGYKIIPSDEEER